ncbi:MAG: hypothetical protein PVS3B3_31260 [Ktedonobacteraceae bacterium]
MKIILPSFYPPDEDDIAIANDPELEYDDAVVNVPLYPDLSDDEITEILEQE